MFRIINADDFTLVSTKNEVIVCDHRCKEIITLEIKPSEKSLPSKNNCSNETSKISKIISEYEISAIECSNSKTLLAVTLDTKQLFVYDSSQNWELINNRNIPKRCTAIKFSRDDKHILLADKSGDVHKIETFNIATPELLVGHVSMLLDLELCDNDKYLVTCDRDEKIRISNYPNCYNIHQFCLGHTDYVSKISYLGQYDLLLSGSGDGKLILWDYKSGHQLDCVNSSEYLCYDKSLVCPSSVPLQSDEENLCQGFDIRNICFDVDNKFIFVSYEKRKEILAFKCSPAKDSKNGRILKFFSTLKLDFIVQDISVFNNSLFVLCGDDFNKNLVLSLYKIREENIEVTEENEVLNKLNVSLLKIKVPADQLSSNRFKCSLHKVRIDNMTEYIERKQQRLQQYASKKRKVTHSDDTPTQP